MPAEFKRAPEVQLVARELINNCTDHQQLAEARILYLFRSGNNWNKGGRPVMGEAKLLSGLPQFLSMTDDGQKYDMAVVINRSYWQALTQAQRRALVDHELSHFIRKTSGRRKIKTRWAITGHEVEDFTMVIRRNGLWTEGIKGFAKAVKQVEAQVTVEDYKGDGKLKTGPEATAARAAS